MSRRTTRIALVGATLGAVVGLAILSWPRGASGPSPTHAGHGDGGQSREPGQVADRAFGAPVVPAADPLPWADVTFEQVKPLGFDLKPGHRIDGMGSLADGLIAYGRAADPRTLDDPDGLTDTGTIWRSSDGRTWLPTPIVAGVRPDSVSEVRAVAAGPAGIVVVGGVCCREERHAAWWSPDGVDVERVDIPAGVFFDVAAGPSGFAIVGSVGDRGAIWTSPDGRAWTEVDAADAGLVRGSLSTVAVLGDRFVAGGIADPGVGDSDAALWASAPGGLDGWQRLAADDAALAGPDEATIDRLIPFADGLLAVGGSGSREDRLDCERLLGGAHVAGLETALSCGWLRDMLFVSPDGERWERADPNGPDGDWPPLFQGPRPPFAPASWRQVVAGGPGLIAVPEEVPGPVGDGENTIGVWTSADGRTWSRVAGAPTPRDGYAAGIAVAGRRLYIIDATADAFIGTVRP